MSESEAYSRAVYSYSALADYQTHLEQEGADLRKDDKYWERRR